MTKERKALLRNSDFSKVCLDAWQSCLRSQTQAVSISDGYAFQNTVRFLFEQRAHRNHINSYFQRWQELAPDAVEARSWNDKVLENLAERHGLC